MGKSGRRRRKDSDGSSEENEATKRAKAMQSPDMMGYLMGEFAKLNARFDNSDGAIATLKEKIASQDERIAALEAATKDKANETTYAEKAAGGGRRRPARRAGCA